MIALSLLFGASRLEASQGEQSRVQNSQIEKKQEEREPAPHIKQFNEAVKKAMAEIQKQQVEKKAKQLDMPVNPTRVYDGKSITLSAKYELKDDDSRIAKLGADFTVDENRRAKSVVLKGESDLGSLVMSYDLQTRTNLISMSTGKKGYGANVLLRNGDPTFSARANLIGKELRVSSTYNPSADYIATNFSGELKFGLKYAVGKEWIGDKDRTSIMLAYSMPKGIKEYFEGISIEHMSYNQRQSNRIQARGALGPVKVFVGLDNYVNPNKYNPSIRFSFSKSF